MMQFSEEQLRNSPFGYNDELAYAALEEINAGDFILGHISPLQYNFSFGLNLYNSYFHHEFSHLVLGLSMMKWGKNPFPFEYGYNGNYMAEVLVLDMQDYFTDIFFDSIDADKDKLVQAVTSQYTLNGEYTDMKNSLQAAELMLTKPSIKRIFDARRELKFDNDEFIRRDDIPTIRAKLKEADLDDIIYLGQGMPEDFVAQFYEDMKPIRRLIERNYDRLIEDENLDIERSKASLRDYLKIIPVHVLWDVMNEPELAETLDLDHRELLTWDFIMLHDCDMQDLMSDTTLGSIFVRKFVSENAGELHSCPYDEAQLIEQNIDGLTGLIYEISRHVDIPDKTESIRSDLKKMNERRKEIFAPIFSTLMTKGFEPMRQELVKIGHPIWEQKKQAQVTIGTTPSP